MIKNLDTERLMLRPFSLKDANDLYEMNLDPLVVRYTGDGAFNSIEEAKELIRHYDQYKKYGMGRLAVFRKSDGSFLGWCGLKYQTDDKIVDIGYRFYRKFWGFGYATEAAKICLADGFYRLQLKTIYGHVHEENDASGRVLKKCGLKFVKNITYDKQPAKLYRIRKDEFKIL